MKHLKKFLLSLLIFSGSMGIIHSQDTKPYGSLANQTSVREELSIANKNGIQNAYAFTQRYKGVLGDPFMENKWSEGKICLTQDSAIVEKQQVRIKFSSYTNELWILNGQDSMIAFSKDIRWFAFTKSLSEDVFEKHPEINPSDPDRFYKNVYTDKEFRLVQDVRKKLKKADYVDRGMYTSGSQYDRFEDDNEYHLCYQNRPPTKVKLSVSSFKKALPKNMSKKLDAQAKKHMIPSKFSERDARRLLESLKTDDKN